MYKLYSLKVLLKYILLVPTFGVPDKQTSVYPYIFTSLDFTYCSRSNNNKLNNFYLKS